MKQGTVDEAAKEILTHQKITFFDRCWGIHTFWSARLSITDRNLPRNGTAGILAESSSNGK